MSELSMSHEERESFLAAVHVGVLSVARPDGPPLMTPIWYRYADGVVQMATQHSSHKVRLMQSTGVASLCVQREEHPPAFVTVDGPVSVSPASRDDIVPIASRYLPANEALAFADSTPDDVIVTLTPTRWFTIDFAKLPG